MKRTLSCILTLLIIFGTIIGMTVSVSADTELVTYLKSLIGSEAKEWGGGSGTQCVELPKYYVEEYFGVATKKR